MKTAAIVLAVALSLSVAPALAGSPGVPEDRFEITIGGLFATVDSKAGAGGVQGGVGATIIFEDLFDIPLGQSTWFLNGSWRMTGRSYLDIGYLNIDRSGARDLDEDVVFRGYTFLEGTRVTGTIDSAFPYAAYRYDFLQTDPVRISGSAGISYLDLGASLSAAGGVLDPDGELIEGASEIGASIQMPVPLLGFQLDWQVSKRNAIVVYGRFIYADFAGLRANIGEQSYHWYFQAWKNGAVGAGIDKISIDIPKYEKDDRYATFNYQLSGVTIFGRFNF